MDELVPQVKLSNKNIYVYHYTHNQEMFGHIKKEGLCAPSKLAGTEVFKSILENYEGRIKKVYKGKITEEVVLDYLDYSRALILDQFYGGRNMIFFLFQPLETGISKAHDRFRKNPLIKLNLTKLIKDEKIKMFVVELPGKPIDSNTAEINISEVERFQNVDLMDFYDKKTAGRLAFAGVPHLAIWIKDGQIDKRYISY